MKILTDSWHYRYIQDSLRQSTVFMNDEDLHKIIQSRDTICSYFKLFVFAALLSNFLAISLLFVLSIAAVIGSILSSVSSIFFIAVSIVAMIVMMIVISAVYGSMERSFFDEASDMLYNKDWKPPVSNCKKVDFVE